MIDWVLVVEIVAVFLILVGALAWLADSIGGAGFVSNYKDILVGLTLLGGRVAIVLVFCFLLVDIGRRIIT